MRVTLKHLFAPNVTMEYPEVRPAIPPGYRGVPTLVKDPNGRAYNRTAHLAEREKMMQQWADYLDNLKSGAKVIRLPERASK